MINLACILVISWQIKEIKGLELILSAQRLHLKKRSHCLYVSSQIPMWVCNPSHTESIANICSLCSWWRMVLAISGSEPAIFQQWHKRISCTSITTLYNHSQQKSIAKFTNCQTSKRLGCNSQSHWILLLSAKNRNRRQVWTPKLDRWRPEKHQTTFFLLFISTNIHHTIKTMWTQSHGCTS